MAGEGPNGEDQKKRVMFKLQNAIRLRTTPAWIIPPTIISDVENYLPEVYGDKSLQTSRDGRRFPRLCLQCQSRKSRGPDESLGTMNPGLD